MIPSLQQRAGPNPRRPLETSDGTNFKLTSTLNRPGLRLDAVSAHTPARFMKKLLWSFVRPCEEALCSSERGPNSACPTRCGSSPVESLSLSLSLAPRNQPKFLQHASIHASTYRTEGALRSVGRWFVRPRGPSPSGPDQSRTCAKPVTTLALDDPNPIEPVFASFGDHHQSPSQSPTHPRVKILACASCDIAVR